MIEHTQEIFIRYVATLLIASSLYLTSIAQPINSIVGDVVQPTPGAASLGQYGDIPVGYVTGTPSISIPLQGIQEGKLSLPVSLSYHASGIKVAQMSSWVGLGWSLSAGGSISRTVLDIHDEVPVRGYYNNTLDITDEATFCPERISGLELDTEPDVFVINLPTMSAKFFIDADQNIQLVDKTQQLKIELLIGVSPDFFKGFVVTTPQGNRHYFGHYNGTDAKETLYVNNQNSIYTNEWKLLAIETYDNADQIYFNYTPESYNYKSLSNCIREAGTGITEASICPGLNGTEIINFNSYAYSQQYVSGLRLNQITTGSGTKSMSFHANTVRTDLLGSAHQLDSIDYHTGTYCKRYKFAYSYFEDPSVTDRMGANNSFGRRLKLDQLLEIACDQSESVEPYVFSYSAPLNTNGNNTQYLAHRLSKRIDHWGFFNNMVGNDNDEVLVPSTKLTVNPSGATDSYGNTDRSSNMDVMDYGVLNKITYPHKGSTHFEYEPHCVSGIDATNSAMELERVTTCGTLGNTCCGELVETTTPVSFTSNAQLNSLEFTLNITEPFPGCNGVQPNVVLEMYEGSVLIGSYQLVLPPGEMSEMSPEMNLSMILNNNQTLSVNTFYTFKVKSYEGRGEFKLFVDNYTTTNVVVGGLRIKQITTHDGMDASRDIVKTYEYELNNSMLSSGVCSAVLYMEYRLTVLIVTLIHMNID